MDNEFKTKAITFKILKEVNNMSLIEVTHYEYRKSDSIYFSRILKSNLLGYLLDTNPFNIPNYLVTTCCFNKMEHENICPHCNSTYPEKNKFFLNCNIFLSYTYYTKLTKKYNLGITEEFYRDQRLSLSKLEKDEILSVALSPFRIKKILEVANDSWTNIDKYI